MAGCRLGPTTTGSRNLPGSGWMARAAAAALQKLTQGLEDPYQQRQDRSGIRN
jgi:hypothetical protein